MPVTEAGVVGPQVLPAPGQPGLTRIGPSGELVTTEYRGKYYEQNYRGNLFIATMPAGAAIPAFGTAAQQFLFWNPPGSGVNCVPSRLIVGYVSGTNAPGYLCIGHSLTVQASPGTLTPAFITPGKPGGAGQGRVQVYAPGSPATVLTFHSPLDLSVDTAAAASTNAAGKWAHDFDGMFICPPGGLFSIAGNIALTTTVIMSMVYEEVPV